MPMLFVSHSTKDDEDVTLIHNTLERALFETFVDHVDLRTGENWDTRIKQAVEDCDAGVFVLSAHSIKSRVCLDEANRILNADKALFILNLDGTDFADMPMGFPTFNVADISGDNFLSGLDRAINDIRAYFAALLPEPETPERYEEKMARLEPILEAERHARAKAEEERHHRARQTIVNRLHGVPEAADFLDRVGYIERLCDRISGGEGGVVVVTGQGGMGKTAISGRLFDDLVNKKPELNTVKLAPAHVDGVLYLTAKEGIMHDVSLSRIFTDTAQLLPELTADLDALAKTGDLTPIEQARAYLDLLAASGKRYLLVLDNMETLTAKQQIVDEELATFLETCAIAPQPALTVFITTREELRQPTSRIGRKNWHNIALDKGLPPEEAIPFLREMDDDGRLGLRDAPDAQLQEAVAKVGGVPRALELIPAILEDYDLPLADLLTREDLFAGHVTQNLAAENYKRLDADCRRILEALAVYNGPVTAAQVEFLLLPWATGLDIPVALRVLHARRHAALDRASGRYSIHPVDRDIVVANLPGEDNDSNAFTRPNLNRRAADYYAGERKPQAEWRSRADLEPQLKEFQYRVAAGDHDTAAALLDDIDFDYLMLWGHSREVVPMREGLLDKITNLWRQAKNHHNLALHYRLLGRVRETIPHLEKSLVTVQGLDDKQAQGAILGTLGIAYKNLGEMKRAVDHYQQALSIAREINDRRSEGTCLGSLGSAYMGLGEMEKAIDNYQQALTIAREINDRRGEGNRLGSLGNAYVGLGEMEKAIDNYQQALSIAREINDRRGEGNRLGSLGNAYVGLGEMEKAIDYHQQAFTIACKIGDRAGEGRNLGNLGTAYKNLGEIEKAIDYHRQALAIAREIGDRRGQGNRLGSLGNTYYSLGDMDKAIDHHKQALIIAREISDRRGEGNRLGSLGNTYGILGEMDKAIDHHKQALVIAREISDRRGKGNSLASLGNAYMGLGEIEKAIDHHKQALVIAYEIRNQRGKGYQLGNLGRAFYALGDLPKATTHLEQAIAIFREIQHPSGLCSRSTGLGWVLLTSDGAARARAAFAEASDMNVPDKNHHAAAGLGVACLRLGGVPAAEAAFALAVTRCDDLLAKSDRVYGTWYTLGLARAGLAHLERGDFAVAADAYRRAVEIAPHAGILAEQRRRLDELAQVPGMDADEIAVLRAILTP